MLEAVVSIIPPHSWIKRVTSNFPAVIRVMDCRNIPKKEGVQELFEITCAAELSEKIINFLKHDDYVYDVDIVKGKPGRVIGSLKTKKCTACRIFASASCYLVSASSRPDGRLQWTLLGSDTMVKSLLKELDDEHVVAEVLKISQLREEDEITSRQEYILQIALEKGYFEFPKQITLRQLAKTLEISPATLTEILRRGQKHVLQEHFKNRPSVLTRQEKILGT
ncbi:MAG TPA: helix-turn-helix domain-containing protein [Candidatus Bathyarchaeia archaeon]|nr:helix-turn-helix domain-containing protein [Candidatus Bathyarchaeia archaeon]